MLLAIPLVLTGLACFHIWNARFTRRIGGYLKDLLGPDSWEQQVAAYKSKTILEGVGVTIIFIVPSVMSLLVSDKYRHDEDLKPLWYGGWILLGLLGLFIVVSIVADWWTERSRS